MFLPLAWLLLIMHLKKKSYAYQTYELTDEGVEDRFEYIHHSKQSIRYSDIKEVILERGILQRKYGLGTICLITNATTRGKYPMSESKFKEPIINKELKTRSPK